MFSHTRTMMVPANGYDPEPPALGAREGSGPFDRLSETWASDLILAKNEEGLPLDDVFRAVAGRCGYSETLSPKVLRRGASAPLTGRNGVVSSACNGRRDDIG